MSDLFSAVKDRTYHLIVSNPPQHLGNQFLAETLVECLSHLKPNGEVYWVMQKHLKPFVKRLFENHFKDFQFVAQDSQYVVVRGKKPES